MNAGTRVLVAGRSSMAVQYCRQQRPQPTLALPARRIHVGVLGLKQLLRRVMKMDRA